MCVFVNMSSARRDAVRLALGHAAVSTLLGLRNGVHYGVKIRAPHALVMTFLFKANQPIKKNLVQILKMTFAHARNLGGFVLIYKALLGCGRLLHLLAGAQVHTPPGTPAAAWPALLAGGGGGWLIWANHSSVNEQIAMYLLSRMVVGLFKLLAKKGARPFCQCNYAQVYPFFAAGVWAIVMWLYETNPDVLQPSLTASMKYLYSDTNVWERGRETFLPTAASAAVVGSMLWLYRAAPADLFDLKKRL